MEVAARILLPETMQITYNSSTNPSQSWLSVSQNASAAINPNTDGVTSGTQITIAADPNIADPSNTAPQTYIGSVTFNPTSANSGTPVTVNVTFIVTNTPSGQQVSYADLAVHVQGVGNGSGENPNPV